MKKKLRLGTRPSPLAIKQAEIVRDLLNKAFPSRFEGLEGIEVVPIRTSGDGLLGPMDASFIDSGTGKGLFTKEIDDHLLAGDIDFAVHSMKDVPLVPPSGLIFTAMPVRADPRDAFLSTKAKTLDELPAGSRVGTSSLRRRAQVLARRPDLQVTPLRGNVDTRLRKLEEGQADATILAVAGLERLGVLACAASVMDTQAMLPSAGQGALGIAIREDDEAMRGILSAIHSEITMICVSAERAVLAVLDGSCRVPVAALATPEEDGTLTVDALAARPDGSEIARAQRKGSLSSAKAVGEELGQAIKARLSPDFWP